MAVFCSIVICSCAPIDGATSVVMSDGDDERWSAESECDRAARAGGEAETIRVGKEEEDGDGDGDGDDEAGENSG